MMMGVRYLREELAQAFMEKTTRPAIVSFVSRGGCIHEYGLGIVPRTNAKTGDDA